MYQDLTKGSITKGLLLFAAPMVAGNLLQQLEKTYIMTPDGKKHKVGKGR